ncbi:MAG TPA: BON domain-containing protein [Chthoniobacterales bacterium]|nr:BON domain-containing protein [Chthoniobacterales bacterium]
MGGGGSREQRLRRAATASLLICALSLCAGLNFAQPRGPLLEPIAPRTDKEIQEEVMKALLANPDVIAASIRVDVMRGFVILRGSVRNLEARKMATKVTRAVPGVRGLRNRLVIESE